MRRVTCVVLALALTLAGCDQEPEAQQSERETQQSNYEQLARVQPAGTMSYSPTRETINFWIETWDEPGKLSFVYLMAANGQLLGYYILEGLPVSYCASLTPTYRWERARSADGSFQTVPAPAMDAVYYSGAQCNVYYGRDATTGAYVEFSVGDGINFLLYEEPLPRPDVEPLGFTTVDDVEEKM